MVRVKSEIVIIAFFLLLFTSLFPSVSASSGTYTIASSTEDVDLLAGVKVNISYKSRVTVSHPSTIGKGKTESWSIELQDGTIDIEVYVPSPVSRRYSKSMSIPIGFYYDIPITTGISARVKVVSSASLSLTGDAILSTDSLFWSSEETRTFNVTTYSYTSGKITVKSNFSFQINLGLVIGLSLFSIEIADTNIGSFPASPKISESMTVSVPSEASEELPLWIHLVAFLIFVMGIATMGMYISAKRKEQKTIRAKPSIRVPKTRGVVYCVYCGEKLPSHAIYCRRCGKEVE